MRAGYLPDGRLLTAIYALGIDPIEELCLYLEKEPRAIRMLNERGEEVAIDFTSVGNGFYSMPLRIEALYPVFLLVD